MEKRNYQKELDYILMNMDTRKKLLLHCCCAPCSSYVLEYLHSYFDITVLFYNPNITIEEEYRKRKKELIRFIANVSYGKNVEFLDCDYEKDQYLECVKGLEQEPERGKRCTKCFSLRLEQTAKLAKERQFDYFCTTLSISPHKNAVLLNEVGEYFGKKYDIPFLPSDFKKKNGYKRSIELSKEYDLYRQDYCGCVFSKASREKEKEENHK